MGVGLLGEADGVPVPEARCRAGTGSPRPLASCCGHVPNLAGGLRGRPTALRGPHIFTFVGPSPPQPQEQSPDLVSTDHTSRLPSSPWGYQASLPGGPEYHSLGLAGCFSKALVSDFSPERFQRSAPSGGDESWFEPAPSISQVRDPSTTHVALALLEGPSAGPALFLRLKSTPRILSCSQGKCNCMASARLCRILLTWELQSL